MRSSTKNYFDSVNMVRKPATAALECSGILPLSCDRHDSSAPAMIMASSSSSKLGHMHQFKKGSSTTKKNNFDLHKLVEATKPIQESICMPLIDWSFADDESSSNHCQERPENDNDEQQPVPEEHDESSRSPIVSPLGKRSRFSGSTSHNRLVRSKALNSHLSLLESSFLSMTDKLDEPRSATDFPFSYDVEKWIELAEHTTVSKSMTTSSLQPTPTSSQQRCDAAVTA